MVGLGGNSDIEIQLSVPYRDTPESSPHTLKGLFVNPDYMVTCIGNPVDDGHTHFCFISLPSMEYNSNMNVDYSFPGRVVGINQMRLGGILDSGWPVFTVYYDDGLESLYICNPANDVPTTVHIEDVEGELLGLLRNLPGTAYLGNTEIFYVRTYNHPTDLNLSKTILRHFNAAGTELDSKVFAGVPDRVISTSDGVCMQFGSEVKVIQGTTVLRTVTLPPNSVMSAILGNGKIALLNTLPAS